MDARNSPAMRVRYVVALDAVAGLGAKLDSVKPAGQKHLCLIPQLELRLIRLHQLHGGIGDGIGCRQQHGIGGVQIPVGYGVDLVADRDAMVGSL
jgi:hypothetical protein